MSHDIEEWCKIWRKTDLLFQKWHQFGEFWPEHLKFTKFLLWLFFCGRYVTCYQKSTEELSFTLLKSDAKFEEKLTCGLENDERNMTNFHRSTWKSQTWDFDAMLLSKVENVWAWHLQRNCFVMTIKTDAKFEEELTCRFKIGMRNLKNFDWST